jgi:hypothetical protein
VWLGDLGTGRGRGGPLNREAFDARAANMGPPRRVVVWNHPPDRQPGLQESGTSITDVLRKTVNSKRFVTVSRDSTFSLLDKTRNRDSVMQALNADLMVSIRGTVVHQDTVFWVITLRDPSAYSSYTQRAIVSPRAPLATPLLFVDSMVSQSVHAVEEMDRAPRRRTDGFGPPGATPSPEKPAQPPQPPKKPAAPPS